MTQEVTVEQRIGALAKSAKAACPMIANAPVSQRNAALAAIADAMQETRTALLEANALDLAAAKEAGSTLRLLTDLNSMTIASMEC